MKQKRVRVTLAAHSRALEEVENLKNTCGEQWDQMAEQAKQLVENKKDLDRRAEMLRLHRRTIDALQKELDCERGRAAQCLGVAASAAEASGSIGRVSYRLLDAMAALRRTQEKR